MAEDPTQAERFSCPKIDISSTTPSRSTDIDSLHPSNRPHTLQERILNSVANSLSIPPERLRETFASDAATAGDDDDDDDDDDDNHHHHHHHRRPSAGANSNDKPRPPRIDLLTIQTKVLAGSKTLADMETKFVPPSARSMAAEVVDMTSCDSASDVTTQGDEYGEQAGGGQNESKDDIDHDDGSSSDDDLDMRSASIMIAPERIHRASRMNSIHVRNQDFDKHVRMPSLDDAPPMPTTSYETPGEVERFLGSEKGVSKVVIIKPRAGLFEEKLVACLTLTSIPPSGTDLSKVDLVSPAQSFFAGTQIATIKHNLEKSKFVDQSAIPQVWVPLQNMPLVPETDNIDRRKLRTWVQNANSDIYDRVLGIATDQTLQHPETEMEREVQKLVARVLHVPQDQVGINFTFASLGGDEATAMALVTTARVESIFLESHEILHQNNTLAHLASLATQRGGLAHKWAAQRESNDMGRDTSPSSTYFDLSPMQKLYFTTTMGGNLSLRDAPDGRYRFNSSLLFRVAKGFSVHDMSAAVDAVVGHHKMLRARFVNVQGDWTQYIVPKVEGSYSFMHYIISTNQQVEAVVQNTQASINVEAGPLFAVAHLETTDGHQMIYVAAHHLVVDIASWRLIIRDLDELLQHGSLASPRAMPFQKWTELQKMDAQMPSGGLPFDLCPGDFDYWGMTEMPNTYADADEASFSLSEELTSILETTCNQVLRTESVDIYISALLLSFAQTFVDRRVPDVWNQELGRNLWNNDIDISETVGWFTSLCPLNQQINASSDLVDVLRRLKDTRRAIPHRGAHYFASKFYSENHRQNQDAAAVASAAAAAAAAATSSIDSGGAGQPRSPECLQIATRDWPIEILFSYAGNVQNLGKENGVLEQIALPGRTIDSPISDIGPAVGRIALFEVNTTIDQGSARIKFLYNRHSRHIDLIKAWISNYEHLLLEAIGRLRFAEPEWTLADIPQLWATGATYEGLATLTKTITAELGLGGVNDIDAVYPVTPVQQSILISQARALQFPAGCGRRHGDDNSERQYAQLYPNSSNNNANMNAHHIHVMYEFVSPNGATVDLSRLVTAWVQVVAHHAALRTVFIESISEQGLFNAVVLKRWAPNMLFLDATPTEDPIDTLNNLPPLNAQPTDKSVPRHRLTVCQSALKTVVKLDVSAALCDMMSVNSMIADLKRAYTTGRAVAFGGAEVAAFSYTGYLDIMRNLDRDRSISWWKQTLAGVTQPCLFPQLDLYYGGDIKGPPKPRRHDNVHTEVSDVTLQKVSEFCRAQKTTTGTVLRLAWALVLRSVTGSSDVCFGYKAPGRSATLEGMRSAVGCFANTIPVVLDLSQFKPLAILLKQTEDGYNAALPHQHITMAEMQHALLQDSKGTGFDARLFNTCFAYTEEPSDMHSRSTSHSTMNTTALELRNVMNHETSDYDLIMNTRFRSSTGQLVVDLGSSILSETQAENIINTFARAITAIIQCASPSAHIGSLDLFSDRDYAQIVGWTHPLDKDNEQQQQRSLLHELVFEQSIARPESKAVCAHDGDLTYVQVEVLSHRLAHVLLSAGVVPRSKAKAAVPVILDKSKWVPVALLAVLKAGAAFVPVDADEMGFVAKIAEHLGPAGKVAVACVAAADALEMSTDQVPLFDRVVRLDDALMQRLERETVPAGQLLPPSKPEDVACVFFTPTSSRSIRGISFTHASLSTCFVGQGPVCGIDSTARVLQLSSFNVDVALSEVFTTLVNGGVMCIPSSRDRYNDYTGCVTRFSANWSYMTPLLSRKLNTELLPTLKTVCFRTRGLDEDTYRPWQGRKRVIMAYGAPDVCPLGISFLELHGPHHLRAIGRPIAGSAWIVSGEDHRNLMPVGAVGEMVIEGPTLGKTFRRSSLNVFLEDDIENNKDLPDTPTSPNGQNKTPFVRGHHHNQKSISTIATEDTGQGKKRYYKTGHSVRYIEGGLMEYVSSKRDDLEINGRLVNLSELEQYIRRALGHGVDVMVEALTFKGDRVASPVLAAFLELGDQADGVVAATAASTTPPSAPPPNLDLTNLDEEVKRRVYLAKRLVTKALSGVVPEAIIPKIFIPVRHLPTTHSLKVNRRRLQKIIKGLSRDQLLDLARPENVEQLRGGSDTMNEMTTLPSGSLEASLRDIWAQVLGRAPESISLDDGFLKVGGDEVAAAEVVVRCRRAKLAANVSDLMRDVSLGEICHFNTPFDAVSLNHQGYSSNLSREPSQAGTYVLDTALDNAIESIQRQQQQQQQQQQHQQQQQNYFQHQGQPAREPRQDLSVDTPLLPPTPQIIDRAFIEEKLAPKLLLEPEVIRDVAEATSTQIRHIETALLTQGHMQRSSSSASPHGPGLADMTYFVLHFTAASSTSSVSARRIEEVCHILTTIHPILRTAFVAHVEGQSRKLYQVVLRNHKADFKHIPRVQSWRLNATLDKEIKKDREILHTRCDLFACPITRFIFVDAGKTSALVLRLSRAQYDDVSIAHLIKDLRKLYDGTQNPPRRPGFADFVREAALAHVGGEAERYWRGLLEGAEPTQVVHHTRPPRPTTAMRTLRESVSVNTVAMGSLGISFDTVLKAAWGMVLATIAGVPDVLFGELVEGCHSRMQQHLGPSSVNRGGVLGPTTTVLPVRIRFADTATSPLHLLKCVADQRSAGMPYENLGMLDIVEKCTPWPYWTRLSTVVQHRTDAELLMDGKAKSFRLGATLCKISVIESEVADVPDFLVRSLLRSKSAPASTGGAAAGGPGAAGGGASSGTAEDTLGGQARFNAGDEELEISVSFCEQRVPATLAQEVLHKVCGFVGLLTGVSIMQNIVPTASQYASLAKQIPFANPTSVKHNYAANGSHAQSSGPAGVTFNNPFGGGAVRATFAQLEAKMSLDQITTIRATIEDAWRSTLDPRTLGVPEEHVTSAAFYDLWGSLIPASQLADFITEEVPHRLVGELSTNLFNNNLDGFALTMDEIVDHPTMLDQFQLVVRKAFGGEGRDRAASVLKTRNNSVANNSSVRRSNNPMGTGNGGGSSLSNASSVRSSSPTMSLHSVVTRNGTISTVHGPSRLGGHGHGPGHARTRSDSTERSMAGASSTHSSNDSPAMGAAPVFPAHPAVKPPIHNHHYSQVNNNNNNNNNNNKGRNRQGSDASNGTYQSINPATTTVTNLENAGRGGGGGPVSGGFTNTMATPPTSIGSPDLSELPGSAAVASAVKRSHSVVRLQQAAAADLGPESPVLGNVNLATSPPVVQTGFGMAAAVAAAPAAGARKKSNFGFGSSLRRIASNALRPGLQNHHGHGQSSSLGSLKLSSSGGGNGISSNLPQRPPTSGSITSNSGKDREREMGTTAMGNGPVSPWMRVQSMAPQLPPFSPFTPVTVEDTFSLANDDGGTTTSASASVDTGASPDLSQGRTSRSTSPDLILQCNTTNTNMTADDYVVVGGGSGGSSSSSSSTNNNNNNKMPMRISGTLVMDENGQLTRAVSYESLTESARGGGGDVSSQSHDDDDEDEDEEDTLRAEDAQKLLAKAINLAGYRNGGSTQTGKRSTASTLTSTGTAATAIKRAQQQQPPQQLPSPSPVTETFYMEDDEGSEESDGGGSQLAYHNNNNNNNYQNTSSSNVSYVSADDGAVAEKSVSGIPKQGDGGAAKPPSQQSPRYSVFPRASTHASPPPPAAAAAAAATGIRTASSAAAAVAVQSKQAQQAATTAVPTVPAPAPPAPFPSSSSSSTTATQAYSSVPPPPAQPKKPTPDPQDYASLEAAEMDDIVSPLTPVERAMLYKQQGMMQMHGGSLGGFGGGQSRYSHVGASRGLSMMGSNTVSPLTPASFFVQQGQQMPYPQQPQQQQQQQQYQEYQQQQHQEQQQQQWYYEQGGQYRQGQGDEQQQQYYSSMGGFYAI